MIIRFNDDVVVGNDDLIPSDERADAGSSRQL